MSLENNRIFRLAQVKANTDYGDTPEKCPLCGKRFMKAFRKEDGSREFKHQELAKFANGKQYTRATYCRQDR